MQGQRGTGVIVENNAQTPEAILHHRVIAVYYFLGSYFFLVGANRNGNAVFIRTADEHNVAPLQALIAHIDIRRNVSPREVTQVEGPIGIGKCGCYKYL